LALLAKHCFAVLVCHRGTEPQKADTENILTITLLYKIFIFR
jgi:hypothetical protein